MAESDGERLEAKFGDKSLGITTKDLIPVLLIAMMGMGGYLIYQNIRWALQAIFNRQQLMLDRMDTQDDKLAFQTREFARLLAILDYNQGRPQEEHLPMEIDALWLPKPVLPELPLRRGGKKTPATRDGME